MTKLGFAPPRPVSLHAKWRYAMENGPTRSGAATLLDYAAQWIRERVGLRPGSGLPSWSG
jgi:hypothetical protein